MKRTPTGQLELAWMGKGLGLISAEDGKYSYAWVDKADVRVREVRSIETVETIGDDADGNLLIHGDSGDALRSILTIPEYAKKYRGEVKLAYIDPPFNTSKSFDHYEDQLEHSVWLTMMQDRIRMLAQMLHPEGSIWVHLDQVEVHRMRLLLDEELGADKFVAAIAWEKDKGRRNDTDVSSAYDTILVYAPLGKRWKGVRNLLPRGDQNLRYKNPDNDPRGPWLQGDNGTTKSGTDAAKFEVKLPSGRIVTPGGRYWGFNPEQLEQARAEGRVWFGQKGDSLPVIKRYLTDVQDGVVPRDWWTADEVGTNQDAKRDHLNKMFPDVENPFDTPKPEKLMARIISITTKPGDLVADVFGGSGSTAAAAHKMGRRWLLVELKESTIETFTKPRLTKVIRGEDPGGITKSRVRVATETLPKEMTAEEAALFQSLLRKVVADPLTAGAGKATLKLLRDATATKWDDTLLWEGGGGFTVARLGPSMYEVEDETGDVYLSPAATNGAWSKAIAGQLKFTLTTDHPVFTGARGRQRLAVVDGVVDEQVVNTVVSALREKERAVVVGKAVLPEAEQLLRELSPGSRVRQAPDQVFPKGIVS